MPKQTVKKKPVATKKPAAKPKAKTTTKPAPKPRAKTKPAPAPVVVVDKEVEFPYDDPYNPYISPERKLRLGRWS